MHSFRPSGLEKPWSAAPPSLPQLGVLKLVCIVEIIRGSSNHGYTLRLFFSHILAVAKAVAGGGWQWRVAATCKQGD